MGGLFWCPYESPEIPQIMNRWTHQIKVIVDMYMNVHYHRILSTLTTTSKLQNERYGWIHIIMSSGSRYKNFLLMLNLMHKLNNQKLICNKVFYCLLKVFPISSSRRIKVMFTVLSFGQITKVFGLLLSVMFTGLIWSAFFGHLSNPLEYLADYFLPCIARDICRLTRDSIGSDTWPRKVQQFCQKFK